MVRSSCLLIVRWLCFFAVVICLVPATAPLRAQRMSLYNPVEVEPEIYFEDITPIRTEQLIGGAKGSFLYTEGVELDVHFHRRRFIHYLNPLSAGFDFLGPFTHARVDWSPEVLPVCVLLEPQKTDIWGNDLSPNKKKTVYGTAVTPIGYRFVWRGNKAVRPFFNGKLGGIAFTQKALAPSASYANFTAQGIIGTEIKLNKRLDLRVAGEYFHFSNLYFAADNPGFDEATINFGLSYHVRHLWFPFLSAGSPPE